MKAILFLSSCRAGPSFTGVGSWGDRVGKVLKETLDEAGFETSVWDPKDPETPYTILEQPIHMVKDNSSFPKWMHANLKELQEADAFVICSAEYNSALPPGLTNMLDHYPPSAYRHRPVGLLTYSVSKVGGARIQPTLKAFCTELGMVPVPTMGNVAEVMKKFDTEGNPTDESVKKYMARQANELMWYAEALKSYKKVKPAPVPGH